MKEYSVPLQEQAINITASQSSALSSIDLPKQARFYPGALKSHQGRDLKTHHLAHKPLLPTQNPAQSPHSLTVSRSRSYIPAFEGIDPYI